MSDLNGRQSATLVKTRYRLLIVAADRPEYPVLRDQQLEALLQLVSVITLGREAVDSEAGR